MQDLISVTFEDQTNYADTNTDDILGIPFNFYWGPVNKVIICDRNKFFQYYPEAFPLGAKALNLQEYFAYAQIKKAFASGISSVEVCRVNGNQWQYQQVNVSAEGVMTFTKSSEQFNSGVPMSFALKYPGYIPQSLVPGYSKVGMKLDIDTSGVITVDVIGYKDINGVTHQTTIESWQGSANPQALQEGKSFYLPTVLEESEFLLVQINSAVELITGTPTIEFEDFGSLNGTEPSISNADYEKVFNGVYADIEQSRATLVISPVSDESLNDAITLLAQKRMNLNAVIGYPVAQPFNEEAIETFRGKATKDKFTFFVAGREMITVFGQKMLSNCVAGWCGATAKVAKAVRLNQLASARTYGTYTGSLEKTLGFDEVLRLHEKGVISVYNSNSGPQIFGVRSMNEKQNSYFGKANVMRVLASILKNIFPIALDAIHTDAAAEPISRAGVSTAVNSVVGDYIAARNLKAASFGDAADEINTDYLTKGGKILNIRLVLYFIGLVESVSIRVIATDSSVTAEIV